VAWWRRLTASRRGLLALLIGLGVLDYAAAKGLRALRDGRPNVGAAGPAAADAVLSSESPVTLPVPGTASVSSGVSVAVAAGVSVFVAPSLIDQVELDTPSAPTPVDPFGLADSAGPGLPVPDANRGALVARFQAELPFAVGSRACIFTASQSGRLHFGVNDPDPSKNRGSFSVTVSIPESRSVLAATPACGTVLR
jgi:hypothetical protein